MSSTAQATSSTSSTSNIQLITKALVDYAEMTGIDLSKNPFAAAIEGANSSEAILELLQERQKAFKDFREEDRRIISYLSPAVNVIQAFSGVLSEAVPFPPAKALFAGIDVLLSAASGVTSSYDTLLDIFESLGNFLKRLEVYATISLTQMMTDLIVKIMAELLSVLALATNEIKQGRLKKFVKKIGGGRKGKAQAALEKLDRLMKDEGLSAVAEILGVVHGIADDRRAVREDGKAPTGGIEQKPEAEAAKLEGGTKAAKLEGGTYYITNSETKECVCLYNKSSPIYMGGQSGNDKERWRVQTSNRARGTYTIHNLFFEPERIYAGAPVQNRARVCGQEGRVEWEIKAVNPLQYRILLHGKAWSATEDNTVQLADIDKNATNQLWEFER